MKKKMVVLGLSVTVLALVGCMGNVEAETINETEQAITYESFEGFYTSFTSESKTNPEGMIVVKDDTILAGWWMSEYDTLNIDAKSMEDSTLLIEYSSEDTAGTFQLTLVADADEKALLTKSGEIFYSLTEEEAADYGYNTTLFFED